MTVRTTQRYIEDNQLTLVPCRANQRRLHACQRQQWLLSSIARSMTAALIPPPLSLLSKSNHTIAFELIQMSSRLWEDESTAGVRNSHPRQQGYWARCFELICGECLLLCMHIFLAPASQLLASSLLASPSR